MSDFMVNKYTFKPNRFYVAKLISLYGPYNALSMGKKSNNRLIGLHNIEELWLIGWLVDWLVGRFFSSKMGYIRD